ncbi:MAG: uncharacterized membrane protein YbhN (UPF0104 family) [Glaciecola sp.]
MKQYVCLTIARAFGWYVAFLIISGMVFVGVLAQLMGEVSIGLSHGLLYCGAFVVAWLVGLVTPGAPAGVGVRELVLMVLLKELVPEADLLMAVLLSRVVKAGCDGLFFLLVSLYSFRKTSLKIAV